MTGVPSSASSSLTRIRRPSTAKIWALCRPIGLGRSGDRVLDTPSGGLAGSSPGTVASSSRRARSSQVSKMTCSPARKSRVPSATSGTTASRRCAFATLPGRLRRVFQRRFHPGHRPDFIPLRVPPRGACQRAGACGGVIGAQAAAGPVLVPHTVLLARITGHSSSAQVCHGYDRSWQELEGVADDLAGLAGGLARA